MKIFLSILLLLCSFLHFGCSSKREIQNSINNSNSKAVVLAAYRHLAPGNKDGYFCSRILGVWEPLITRDDNGKPAPCLAEHWEMRDSGREWIFYLRQGVYFHNGTLFTADAVIKNFERLRTGLKRSNYYNLSLDLYYPALKKVIKLDDYTVKLIFAEPNVNQLYKMTDFGSPIYAPECLAADGNFSSNVIGTGPYKITENAIGQHVVLERNDNYYGQKAAVEKIIVKNIPNADTRFAALKSGEIDGVIDLNAMPPFLAEEAKKDERLAVDTNKSTMIRYLALNNKKFPFNDVRMRQAVSLAIDRNNLVQALYLGYGEPTVNAVNYTSVGYKYFPVRYDLQHAKELAHSVLGDQRCEVTYCINGAEPLQKGEAELIAYWLKEIGLDVKIQSLEYGTRAKLMRKGEYDIARLQKGLANSDPYDVLYSFFMPQGALNLSSNVGYYNQEVVDLMQRVKHTVDDKERQTVFDRVQEITVEEQPVVPLFNDVNIVVYNKRLKDYRALVYGIDLSKIRFAERG